MDLQILLDALISLIPPALVGVLFYVIMRGIFRADATERKIYAQMEADMRAFFFVYTNFGRSVP